MGSSLRGFAPLDVLLPPISSAPGYRRDSLASICKRSKLLIQLHTTFTWFSQTWPLSIPWSLRPRNRAVAATCGRGRCELPAILRLPQKSLAAGEAQSPAISAAEWLRARLQPPAILRCDLSFVLLSLAVTLLTTQSEIHLGRFKRGIS